MFARFRRSVKTDENSKDTSQKKKTKKSAKSKDEVERTKFVNVRYRQWLFDRIEGIPRPSEGKNDHGDAYPPSSLCLPFSMIRCCPWLLEENCACTLLGKLGCCEAAWVRHSIMRYTLFLNIVALFVGIFSCLAITDSNYDLLQISSFASSELILDPDDFFQLPLEIHVGLSAATIDNPNFRIREIVPFQSFCDNLGNGIESYIEKPTNETCGKCHDVRPQMVSGLLVGVVCLVPAIVAQWSRMYETTDLNCQKFWTILLELISLAGFVLTWYQFTYGCFQASFYDGSVGYSGDGEVTEADSINEIARTDFDWDSGNGMLCLYATFGLKVVSLLCNCFLPTPTITRNTYEQKIYEVKAKDYELGSDRVESFSEGNNNEDSPSGSRAEGSENESSSYS